ncbi:MAG: two-component regulator propeller domain-containing protein [Chitinophagaceae bacterium]
MLIKPLLISFLLAICLAATCQQQSAAVNRQNPQVPYNVTVDVNLSQSANTIHTRKYHFTHFSSANGLSSNIVKNVVQDHKGYMWFATLDGLQRYDGNKFITFRNEPGNPYSVPSDLVGQVMEDNYQHLWVLGGGKAGIFNTSNFTFSEVPILAGDAHIQSDLTPGFSNAFMSKDHRGNALLFWIGKGVFMYDSVKNAFVAARFFNIPENWGITDINCSPATSQYLFSGNSGMLLYNMKTGNINYAGHNPDKVQLIEDLKEEKWLSNIIGYQGKVLWFVNWPPSGGPFLHAYNTVTREHRRYNISQLLGLGYYEIADALIQDNGRMWVYGRTFIAEYNDSTQTFRLIRNEYVDEQSIRFDQVSNMCQDKQKNIWISTENGVFLFNPDKEFFNNYSLIRPDGSGIIDGPVITAKQISKNEIWVGCWGTGLYAYDNNFNPINLPPSLQKYKQPFGLWTIHQHSSTGLIWFGLQDGGMLVYNPATGKDEHYYDKIFGNSTIRQIVEDHEGNLWFGMQGGHIVKWDPIAAKGDIHKGLKLIRKRDAARVYKLLVDNKGFLWAGTMMKGVYKYDPATEQELLHITTQEAQGKRLWDNQVSDIIQHDDSTILLAGGAINVLNTRTNTISFITTVNGLSSNNAQCIQRDKDGIYWVGMAHGLCRMNLEKKIFSLYDRRDGMAYDNFNAAGTSILPDGRLVFCTDRSLTVLAPSEIKEAPLPDDVLLTDIRLSNHSLSVDSVMAAGGIVLPYDNAAVALEFSALDFMKQRKMHYHYMLEDLDKTWRDAGTTGQAIYSYLPPGTYTFRVRAENADGIASAHITSIQVKITPPFWKAWWFYSILALLVAVILFWIDRERLNKMRALQRVRTQIAVNLHEEVNSTLSNISLLGEMAKLKADKDTERSKEYISQISVKSKRMMDAMDDILWSISPQNDSMDKTIVRMKEYASKIEKQYHAHINFRSDEGVEKLKLDMKQRHELFIIYKQCVDDAIAHLKCSSLDVFIDRDKAKNRLSLKLRGESEHDIDYTTVLVNIRKRVDSLGATLDTIKDRRQISMILQLPL